MLCGEFKQFSDDYYQGYIKAIEQSFLQAREDICKYMYKSKKTSLSMYEICSLLHTIESDYTKLCSSYGRGIGYDMPSQEQTL